MSLKTQMEQAVRRGREIVGGVWSSGSQAKRRTEALPAVLGPWRPPAGDTLPKPTPANLRKFADTPIPRRAINCCATSKPKDFMQNAKDTSYLTLRNRVS